MPVLEIDGVGRVELGDEFLKLSPDQRQVTVNEIAAAHKPQPGYAADIGKAVPSGLAKGVAGLVGLPGDVGEGVQWLMNHVEQFARGMGDDEFAKIVADRKRKYEEVRSGIPTLTPTSSTVRSGLEKLTGPLYEPQTLPGKLAGKMAEFVPGAVAFGGASPRNLVNFAVAPGLADEATRQLTKGTAAENVAPALAAIAAGGISGVVNRPSSVDRVVRGAMSPQVTPAVVDRAGNLIRDAAGRGVTLTWPEAIEQVAPGSGLTNMQRVLESSPGSREVIAPQMAQRPQQIETAARDTFGAIAPPNRAPSDIGPAVGQAAEGRVNDARQIINQIAEPYYRRAELDRVDPATMGRIRRTPGWAEARDAIRNDPQLDRYVATLPENSVGFLNEVKKYLDTAAENASAPVNAQRNMQRAAGYGADAAAVRQAGINASPAYETALNFESQSRQQFLQPILNGPIGKIAARDTTTKNAIDALFPANPLPNSEQEIGSAVRALVNRNAPAARDLVRAHAEATFNEAAQSLQSGANQFGGAKFAKVIAGNSQQRANLEAAIRALPNGNQTWQGFERFLDIAEATGTRQAIGSKTAFNALELKDMSTGGMASNAVKLGASPGKWLTVVSDAWSRWQLGQNLDQLARILTDPASASRLRAIASRPPGNAAVTLAGQLIATAHTSHESK